jgi:hypothetical protein
VTSSSGFNGIPAKPPIRTSSSSQIFTNWGHNQRVSPASDDGRQVSGVVSVWTSDLKPADYKEVLTGGLRIHQEVDIPVAATSMRMGIEDQKSSRLGTLELPLPVPPPTDLPRIARHSLPEIEPD